MTGSTVRFRIWRDGQVEPSTWNATFTNTAVTAPGRAYVVGFGSPTTARSLFVDDVALSPPRRGGGGLLTGRRHTGEQAPDDPMVAALADVDTLARD